MEGDGVAGDELEHDTVGCHVNDDGAHVRSEQLKERLRAGPRSRRTIVGVDELLDRPAQLNGLVDELGGLRQALASARALAGLSDHAPIEEFPPSQTTLVGRILGIEGVSETLPSHLQVLPPGMMDMVRALGPFVVHPADKPLARMELTSVE